MIVAIKQMESYIHSTDLTLTVLTHTHTHTHIYMAYVKKRQVEQIKVEKAIAVRAELQGRLRHFQNLFGVDRRNHKKLSSLYPRPQSKYLMRYVSQHQPTLNPVFVSFLFLPGTNSHATPTCPAVTSLFPPFTWPSSHTKATCTPIEVGSSGQYLYPFNLS